MRAWNVAKNAVGCAALAAMLLLLSPGVQLVRAGESPVAESEDLACREPQSGNRSEARRQVRLPLAVRGAPADIVVLNARGYNYPVKPPLQRPTRPDPR